LDTSSIGLKDGDSFSVHGREGSWAESLWSRLDGGVVDDENLYGALVESRYIEEENVVFSERHHGLVSSRIRTRCLHFLIGSMNGQVW